MTVHHIIPDNLLGGGTMMAGRLIEALLRIEGEGSHRAILPRDSEPSVRAVYKDLPHSFGDYPGRGSPFVMARAIRRAAKRGDPIHAHGTRAAMAAGLAAAPGGLRTVYTVRGFHGLAQPGPFGIRVRLEHLLARRIDATVFVSKADEELSRRTGLRHRRSMVIENGADLPRPDPEAERDVDILFVGRLVYQKHPEAFVETVARLRGAPKVVMIGAGELAPQVDGIIARAGLADFTRHDGLPSAETLALMRRARILAMTSRWEGLPGVAIEGAQSGALVAGFSIPPLAEVLGPFAERTLTPPEPETLAARLSDLLEDEPRRREMADALQAQVRERFAPERTARRYIALYDEIGRGA